LAAILIHRTRLNRESQMPPSVNLRPTVGPHYRIANLVEKRRDVLRLARFPSKGSEEEPAPTDRGVASYAPSQQGLVGRLHGRLMAEFPEQ
jgi:hypothetical protein